VIIHDEQIEVPPNHHDPLWFSAAALVLVRLMIEA
jgi:hypothetical protein